MIEVIEEIDFYAEMSKNLDDIKSEIKDEWDKIWNYKISIKEKNKEFEKFFKGKILPKMLEMHQIKFYINNSNEKDFIYYQIFKILNLFDCNLNYLSEYAKTLEKIYKNKKHSPKIPSNLGKTYYIETFRKNSYNISLLEDIKNYGITDNVLCTCNVILDFKEMDILSYSIYIQIKFKLKKPYLSKDDDNFYVIDNPIVKDKVFKLPMVRATTWKGALRFAALKVFEEGVKNNKNNSNSEIKIAINEDNWKEKRALLVRLFGNEKDVMEKYLNELIAEKIKGDKSKAGEVEKEFERYLLENGYISKEIPSRTGRLFFYPTFFDQISLDVITPLSRETKTPVRGPIYFETVPEGTEGILRILYYPFDLVAKGEFEKIEGEMREDIEFLSEAMKKMFYETGFSAKKSSGFGVIEKVENGNITVNGYNDSKVKKIISESMANGGEQQ